MKQGSGTANRRLPCSDLVLFFCFFSKTRRRELMQVTARALGSVPELDVTLPLSYRTPKVWFDKAPEAPLACHWKLARRAAVNETNERSERSEHHKRLPALLETRSLPSHCSSTCTCATEDSLLFVEESRDDPNSSLKFRNILEIAKTTCGNKKRCSEFLVKEFCWTAYEALPYPALCGGPAQRMLPDAFQAQCRGGMERRGNGPHPWQNSWPKPSRYYTYALLTMTASI